ncbi:MAG TPA: hypothetical protein VFR67_04485 [Pilimelia sp.]|nr:hypothetical protein [Pilimelia sp.]
MDQSTQDINAFNPPGARQRRHAGNRRGRGNIEVRRSMGPACVVVPDELRQHAM